MVGFKLRVESMAPPIIWPRMMKVDNTICVPPSVLLALGIMPLFKSQNQIKALIVFVAALTNRIVLSTNPRKVARMSWEATTRKYKGYISLSFAFPLLFISHIRSGTCLCIFVCKYYSLPPTIVTIKTKSWRFSKQQLH